MPRSITIEAINSDIAEIDKEIATLEVERAALVDVARSLGGQRAAKPAAPRRARTSTSADEQKRIILDALTDDVPYSIDRLAAATGLSNVTVQRRINELLDDSMVIETTGQARSRRYVTAPGAPPNAPKREARIRPGEPVDNTAS